MNQNITHPGQIKLSLIDYSKVKYNKSEGYTHQVLGIACQLIMILHIGHSMLRSYVTRTLESIHHSFTCQDLTWLYGTGKLELFQLVEYMLLICWLTVVVIAIHCDHPRVS